MEQDNKKNPLEVRNKIIGLLRIRGPSLPIHISRETGLSTLFAGAFLSELASDKTIKISNLKVGGSPLYFLQGQEKQLENFYNYLPGKEKEAFSLLKEKELLEDRKLEPAIRVALRSIKDFAFPLILNLPEEQILFWRFHSFNEEEAKLMVEKIIKPITAKPSVTEKPIIKPQAIEIKPEVKAEKIKVEAKPEAITKPAMRIEKIKKEIEKPLIIIKEKPTKKQKIIEKSDFVKKILNFLGAENIELIEEKEAKKKEFVGIIRINSDLGKLRFLLIAKDKKSIIENDLILALQKAQNLKMPVFFLSTGDLNKKVLSCLENYSSLIKFKKV